MLYGEYRDKLARRRRIFDRVWRFRVPIFLGAALLLALTATLLGVKGTVLGVDVPQTAVYGEPLAVSAQAVFGEAEFEYRAAGEREWTEKTPRRAGEYECRAVGYSVAGVRRVSGVYPFRILPAQREVCVKDEKLTFGDEPSFTANLCYADTLHVGNFFADLRGEKVMVSADPASITVSSAEGADVTACYELIPVERSVEDVFRPLRIRTPDVSFEYDGLPHGSAAADVLFDGLAEGHTVEFSLPARTEAGSCENAIARESVHIYDENGEEVTKRYAFGITNGTLTVERRRMTVRTRSDAFIYDGKAHEYTAYELPHGTPAPGQTVVLSETLVAEHAGSYRNAPKISVWSGTEDVTENYLIMEDFGAVEIAQREITVSVEAQEVPYDGLTHVFPSPSITVGEPAAGQTVRFSEPGSATEAGVYRSEPSVSVFAGETDVTFDYAVTKRFGAFVIAPLAITVKTADDRRDYDGVSHTYGDIETIGALAAGQELSRTNEVVAEDAGVYPNTARYVIRSGGREISRNNYTITEEFGTVEIVKLPVTLKTAGETLPYDGKPHTYRDIEVIGTPAAGQTFVRTDALVAENADTYPNAPAYVITDGGREISRENYVITEAYGDVVITPLAITVTTESGTLPYDGREHTFPAFTCEGELADGQAVALSGLRAFKDAAQYRNAPEISVQSGAKDVTENYEITPIYGEVVITKLAVSLKTYGGTFPYDGKAHVFDAVLGGTYELTAGSLAAGQEIRFTDPLVAENAREYVNEPAAIFVWDGAKDVTRNYTIENAEYGKVVITPLSITVRTKSERLDYNGTVNEYSDIEVVGELAAGQTLERTNSIQAKDAGVYPNTPAYRIRGGGRDISPENYLITEAFGTVEISKLVISVKTRGETFLYDGREHVYEATPEELASGELAAGQTLRYTGPLAARDAREYTNKPTAIAVWDGTEDVTRNYTIARAEYGAVVILRRTVRVGTGTEEFVYDGTPQGCDEVFTLSGGGGYELAAGQSFQVKANTRRTEIGEETNRIDFFVADERGDDVTENYIVAETVFGTLKILPRPLSLGTESGRWEYDGTPHARGEVIPAGGTTLAPGHSLACEIGTPVSLLDVGNCANEFAVSPRIVDGGGADVTRNYEIEKTVVYGTLEVYPRAVKLKTQSLTVRYDGTFHSAAGYTEVLGSLAAGHRLELEYPSAKEVGKYANIPLTARKIFDASARDVTENYQLTFEYGTLVITERELVLRPHGLKTVYDGMPHSAPAYDVAEGDPLAPSQTIEVEYEAFTLAGVYDNMPLSWTIRDETGADVTKFYVLRWDLDDTSKVEIERRPVTFVTEGGTYVYDGTEKRGGYSLKEGSLPLAEGQIFSTILKFPAFTDVGEYENRPTGVYIVAGDAYVTSNYIIEWECEKIYITPRPVSVATASGEWTYDAQLHAARGFSYNEEDYAQPSRFLRFAEGQTLVIDADGYPSLLNVGKEENVPVRYSVMAGGVNVPAGNYEITWKYGTLAVLQRPITVRTRDVAWVYDGTSHTSLGGIDCTYYEGDDLGHTVVPAFTPRTEAGEYSNECTVAVFDGDRNDVTRNYDITVEAAGVVRIGKRSVTITTGSQTWVYEQGATYSTQAYVAEKAEGERGLVGGHAPAFTPTQIDAITDSEDEVRYLDNVWRNIRIYDGSHMDRTGNYIIETEWGKLRVKSPVVVDISTVLREYDGTPLTFFDSDWYISKLPPDVTREQVKVTLGGSITEPGRLTMSEVRALSECSVEAAAGEVNRIDFNGAAAPLVVTKRVIHIRTASISGVRGDTPLLGTDTESPFWISYHQLVKGHRFADTVAVTGVLMPDEDEAQNTIENIAIVDADGNDVTRFYDIKVEYGLLSWETD